MDHEDKTQDDASDGGSSRATFDTAQEFPFTDTHRTFRHGPELSLPQAQSTYVVEDTRKMNESQHAEIAQEEGFGVANCIGSLHITSISANSSTLDATSSSERQSAEPINTEHQANSIPTASSPAHEKIGEIEKKAPEPIVPAAHVTNSNDQHLGPSGANPSLTLGSNAKNAPNTSPIPYKRKAHASTFVQSSHTPASAPATSKPDATSSSAQVPESYNYHRDLMRGSTPDIDAPTAPTHPSPIGPQPQAFSRSALRSSLWSTNRLPPLGQDLDGPLSPLPRSTSDPLVGYRNPFGVIGGSVPPSLSPIGPSTPMQHKTPRLGTSSPDQQSPPFVSPDFAVQYRDTELKHFKTRAKKWQKEWAKCKETARTYEEMLCRILDIDWRPEPNADPEVNPDLFLAFQESMRKRRERRE